MRIKNILIVVLALLLILPSFLMPTAANDDDRSEKEEISTAESGSIAAKDEVVYANLSATGQLENIYLVNIFDIAKEGSIIDYGSYSSIKNLTDLSILKQGNDTIQFTGSEDKFYYQGNLDEGDIPWHFDISYFLNGDKIDPDLLAGEEGTFRMEISTSANKAVDSSFYENFMLQISLELDTNVFGNIHVPQATIANVGKNKQITFTVMPGEDGSFSLEANVNDFKFTGVQIAAIPFNMSFDLPETGDLTEDMTTLADAIEQLSEGVATLKTGVSDLNNGVGEMTSGSSQFNTNMNRVASSSGELTSASKEIQGALQYIASSLGEGLDADGDLSQLEEVATVLSQLSSEMLGMVPGLTQLKDGYVAALTMLTKSIEDIPDIPEETIYELSGQSEDVDQLINAYMTAQGVKQLFMNEEFQLAFISITPAMEGVNLLLTEIGGALNQIANEFNLLVGGLDIGSSLGELETGLAQLSSNYGDFHAGLISYTDGVSQLASGYSGLHTGLTQLHSGTQALEGGVTELQNGTKELRDGTKDMPKQMQEEIDNMLADFDYSDYKPVSFISDKNKHTQSVQFVIHTEGIEKVEEEVAVEIEEKEKKSFWTLLLDLFR